MQERRLSKRLSNEMPARIKQVSYPQLFLQLSLWKYLRVSGGLILATILFLPIFWIPGLVVLVLPAEVYLLDWVHFHYTKSLGKKSIFDQSNEPEYLFSHEERKRTARRRAEDERKRTSGFVKYVI